jgi:hypothetical protein
MLSPSALVIIQTESHVYTDHNSLIYVSSVADMTGAHQHTQLLLVEMESCELFAWADLKLPYSLSTSEVTGIIGLSYSAGLVISLLTIR